MDQAPSAPRTSFSRFGRLPFEPWHECIRFAAMLSVAGPLPFLAVSPSWEESIIASPHLWTSIFFDGGEDEEARIHTFSHLSQDLPLYVVYYYSRDIYGPPRDTKPMERFINNYRLRIQSIETASSGLSRILGTISTSLPALRYLETYDGYINEGLVSNCLNLRVLRAPTIRIADEACLGPHVESIGFEDVEPSKIANLTHRTNIRRLELDLHRSDRHLWDEKPSDSFGTHMANLLTKIGHTLNDLDLSISFHSYSTFIPLVPSIPGLHTLTLELTITEKLEKLSQLSPPRIRHSDIQSVRELFITLREPAEDDNGLKSDPSPADALMQSLTAENPLRSLKIFKFTCFIRCHDDYLGPLLQSAISAHFIRVLVPHPIPTSVRMERQYMPRLQSLILPSLGLYNCINAPNLHELTFMSSTTSNMVPLEIDAVTRLQKLDVPTSVLDYVGISDQCSWNCNSIKFDKLPQEITAFSRLEYVVISGHGTAANEFLWKMLENPEACPRLCSITISAGYPLWGLLFEVLRKRNSGGVQRITRICLPHLPVLQLLYKLVRLLRGETTVFTNRDVDEVIAKRLASPQILGCVHCVEAGYIFCLNRPQSPGYGEVFSSDFQNLLDLDHPVDAKPISASELWNKWRNHQPRWPWPFSDQINEAKHAICSFMHRSVDITEHTLDGMSIPPWISTSGGWDANDGLKDL